jgi:hypothetical protein
MQALQIGRRLIVHVACNFGVMSFEQQVAALFCATSFYV